MKLLVRSHALCDDASPPPEDAAAAAAPTVKPAASQQPPAATCEPAEVSVVPSLRLCRD